MSKIRKNYPASFKSKIALLAIKGDMSVAEIASQHGVHPTQVNQWRRHLLSCAEDCFSGKSEKQQVNHSSEVKELHAKIGQLTVEKDFLLNASNRLGLGGVKKW